MYGWGEIYLHAFRWRSLSEWWSKRPKPSLAEEYKRFKLSVYGDMVYVWHMLTRITPDAAEAIGEIGTFVKKRASAQASRISLKSGK